MFARSSPIKNLSLDFDWSFKPFFLWLRLIGIGFDTSQQIRSKYQRSLLYFYEGACLVLHLVASFLIGIQAFDGKGNLNTRYNSISYQLNNYVNTTNAITRYCVLHTLLLMSSKKDWNALSKKLKLIESNFPLNNQHFKQCRKIFLIGFGIIFLVKFLTSMCWIAFIEC